MADTVVASPYSEVTVTGIEPPPGAVTLTEPVESSPSDHSAATWSVPPAVAPNEAS